MAADNRVPNTSARTALPHASLPLRPKPAVPSYLFPGRDGGGTDSGATTPHEMSEDEGTEYFIAGKSGHLAEAMRQAAPQRKATPEDIDRWIRESGMTSHKRADPLGDEAGSADDELSDENRQVSPKAIAIQVEDLEAAEKEDKGLRGSVY